MFSDKLLDHFQNPRSVGDLAAPAVTVEVENPACGDLMQLAALTEGATIVEARYRVRGCTASIAAGSALAEMLGGRTLEEAAQLRAADIEEALGELPPASKHAAALCIDALKKLLAALPRGR